MIIDNYIAEQFIDPATAPWTPLTAITATISIWSVIKWVKTKVVDDASCTNDWEGYYSYLFTAMQPSTFYIYEIVPSATAYRVSGWIDYRLQNLSMDISDIRWGGGGFSINYGAINSHTTNKMNEIKKELTTIPKMIEDWFSETNSHIDIAKNDIKDTINSIEIPEIPETDVSEITQGIWILKQRFTKLSEFLKKESDIEKEEIRKQLEAKIDEIENAYEDMQNAHSEEIELKTSEVSEKEKLIAEMEETAQELMEELEKEWETKKNEAEQEVKNKIISSLSE